ncbi:hypothetical protein [Hymenobacter ruricola]|uniref:Uncharacterized protein n=1 Tax=Hymenobacter ruricola TaxID=2791023 RepID=A0ABS0I6F4_9BACT|nr:hypothetical protein [Hymenobacter ruricola]MBF9222551.1 hypothetical protein [Hymenobacter ruricola]
MDSATSFDAGAVLDAYFELRSFAGDAIELWSERAFKKNPPRLYRYQRLQALLRAFDLPLALRELENGTFLFGRAPHLYQFIQNELMLLHQQGVLASAPGPAAGLHYRMLYQKLFRLLHEQYQLQQFNSGWLEASSAEAQYVILVARRFINSYDHALLAAVRQTVCRLLDPSARRFSRQELITHFGFPDVDLDEVDFEWI